MHWQRSLLWWIFFVFLAAGAGAAPLSIEILDVSKQPLTAAYQSVYRGGRHTIDLVHQAGVPLLTPVAVALAVLATRFSPLRLPATVAWVALVTLFASLFADILYAVADPRIRLGEKR